MKKYILLLIVLSVFSCKKEKDQNGVTLQKPEMSKVNKHSATLPLQILTINELGTWKEYTVIDEFLRKYTAISANEALNNALELARLTTLLKDSIRSNELINPAFKMRVNVLENEALRLKDMTYISAITAKEVSNQVEKILAAFSATNSKMNTVYSQIALEKEIKFNSTNTEVVKRTSNKKVLIRSKTKIKKDSIYKKPLSNLK